MTTEINGPNNKLRSEQIAHLEIGEWFIYNDILHRIINDHENNVDKRIYINMVTGRSILLPPSNQVNLVDVKIDTKYKNKE